MCIRDRVITSFILSNQRITVISDVIEDSWIRSQTLMTNQAFTIPSHVTEIPEIQRDLELLHAALESNVTVLFKLMDKLYASMNSSENFSQFSKIREDALFLKYFSQLKSSHETELLPEVYSYFEEWPRLIIKNWREQLSPEEMSRYPDYIKKYTIEPPPLRLRWVILMTWLLKTEEWNDESKVPVPMLSRFKMLADDLRCQNELGHLVVSIAKGMVDAFCVGFGLLLGNWTYLGRSAKNFENDSAEISIIFCLKQTLIFSRLWPDISRHQQIPMIIFVISETIISLWILISIRYSNFPLRNHPSIWTSEQIRCFDTWNICTCTSQFRRSIRILKIISCFFLIIFFCHEISEM